MNSKSYKYYLGARAILAGLLLVVLPVPGAAAVAGDAVQALHLTGHWAGLLALAVFVLAYSLVVGEEAIHLRKSKPAVVAAGFIWMLVAIAYAQHGAVHVAEAAVKHALLEFVELFLFLLAAMTYINTMDERGVFDLLRAKLIGQGYSYRSIFWITGFIAFFLSPFADNLTTALLMAMVVAAVGGENTRFIAIGCINIVVAANAGGAFSPFGDITTLMVWQQGIVQFQEFFVLFIPALAGWLATAGIMSFAVSGERPVPVEDRAELRKGAWVVVGLFILTICMAVSFHNILHMPPVLGMMTGLGMLKLFGFYLQTQGDERFDKYAEKNPELDEPIDFDDLPGDMGEAYRRVQLIQMGERLGRLSVTGGTYDIYKNMQEVEWDTLMFFYGIILCVAGLGAFGYLAVTSEFFYVDLGPTYANIFVGFASALIDNIPVMFAVLQMHPEMSHGQWLLVTLTAGIGGSMLSIGSAAGVAVMGQARGVYTFFAHLKWSWAILLGYIISIWLHFIINADAFVT